MTIAVLTTINTKTTATMKTSATLNITTTMTDSTTSVTAAFVAPKAGALLVFSPKPLFRGKLRFGLSNVFHILASFLKIINKSVSFYDKTVTFVA